MWSFKSQAMGKSPCVQFSGGKQEKLYTYSICPASNDRIETMLFKTRYEHVGVNGTLACNLPPFTFKQKLSKIHQRKFMLM